MVQNIVWQKFRPWCFEIKKFFTCSVGCKSLFGSVQPCCVKSKFGTNFFSAKQAKFSTTKKIALVFCSSPIITCICKLCKNNVACDEYEKHVEYCMEGGNYSTLVTIVKYKAIPLPIQPSEGTFNCSEKKFEYANQVAQLVDAKMCSSYHTYVPYDTCILKKNNTSSNTNTNNKC